MGPAGLGKHRVRGRTVRQPLFRLPVTVDAWFAVHPAPEGGQGTTGKNHPAAE